LVMLGRNGRRSADKACYADAAEHSHQARTECHTRPGQRSGMQPSNDILQILLSYKYLR